MHQATADNSINQDIFYKELRAIQQALFCEKQTLHALMDLKYEDAKGAKRQRLLEIDRQVLRHINMWTSKHKSERYMEAQKTVPKRHYKAAKKYVEERYWMFDRYEDLAKSLHRSPSSIKRSVTKLAELGFIFVRNNMHKNKLNRTNFYSINYDKLYEEIESVKYKFKDKAIILYTEMKTILNDLNNYLKNKSDLISVSPILTGQHYPLQKVNSVSSNIITERQEKVFNPYRLLKTFSLDTGKIKNIQKPKVTFFEDNVSTILSDSSQFIANAFEDIPSHSYDNNSSRHTKENTIIEKPFEISGGSQGFSLQHENNKTGICNDKIPNTTDIVLNLATRFSVKSTQSWFLDDLQSRYDTSITKGKSHSDLGPQIVSANNQHDSGCDKTLNNSLAISCEFDTELGVFVDLGGLDYMGDDYNYNYQGTKFKPKPSVNNWSRGPVDSHGVALIPERIVTGESEYCLLARDRLKKYYGQAVYRAWLQDQDFLFYPDSGEFHIICKTRFIKDWLKKNYLNSIEGALLSAVIRKVHLLLTVEESSLENKRIAEDADDEDVCMKLVRKDIVDEIGLIEYTSLFRNVRLVGIGDILCVCESSDKFKLKKLGQYKEMLNKIAKAHNFTMSVCALGNIRLKQT